VWGAGGGGGVWGMDLTSDAKAYEVPPQDSLVACMVLFSNYLRNGASEDKNGSEKAASCNYRLDEPKHYAKIGRFQMTTTTLLAALFIFRSEPNRIDSSRGIIVTKRASRQITPI